MTVLDTNVVAVVLPTIARDLGASLADIEWVVSACVLCFAALLLPAGSIADHFGRRKVFLGGIGLFALASLLCEAAAEFARLVVAGDMPKAVALMSPVSPTIANEIAHRGYATGFVVALLTAAVVAGLSAVVVAIQTQSARGRSSSQTAFAVEEEERSVSKPNVSAASVRAAPLVFDATRTPDAAAGGTEREDTCSA